MIGKTLGNRYVILEEIGGGGMAVVYKARCTLLNRIVAIKVLRPEYSNDENFVMRFRREAQAAASLSHPNIVNIYDVGNEDGIYYIVMEYVEGKTLKEMIKEEAPLPPARVIEIAKQICDALECAHKNKIVHRDIKPHNIIITPEGRIKVADFGIARASTGSTITNTGSLIGSAHYLSPEQARGGFTDERSDIYSLGVLLYEALTGRVPFNGDSPVAVALKHIQEDPKPISEIIPGFPPLLENVIMKCMAKSPGDRFQRAADLKRELMKIEKDLEVANFKPSDLERTMVLEMDNIEPVHQNESKKQKKGHSYVRGIAIISLIAILFAAFSYLGVLLARKYFEVPEVVLPNVIGYSEEEAKRILQERNLKAEVVERIFSDAPEGQVIDQDPKGGITVKINHPPISLTVSKGPKTVTVPRIIGATETEAINIINSNKFKVGKRSTEYSNEYPAGIVIDQNPREGLQLPEGTEINYTVSLGPEVKKINMPLLIGKDLELVEKEIEENGLVLGNVEFTPSDSKKNTIIEQDPKPGAEVEEGSAVNLVVSSGPPVKKVNLSIELPPQPSKFMVKIEISDDLGDRIVYNKKHSPKDSPLEVPIEGMGVIHVKVWIDDILWSEQKL
ncbi:Stk1 family PASTA domain-containing Ser/Thr kinase [Thermosediminibacter oceani]|uniref:non-specific serine/threonine protein kinase n=1 Tax=Thermosediminibacter oceani (strain ATCC BAA-1034 / DSM 16646 / JW/IW-1228P) TaxID=555079 RepID=D9S317_THEOJ|nr:Stk1 family PASTA domain-containing Ser/Thr kinase [Thermosediminibacter oceani]ADL07794.1 serine/threonine protein kinase with PASTA sensor(s) [Thermosediminibacter oceani DSM 16646]